MAKKKSLSTTQHVQYAARLIRTLLAARLSQLGLYPGQDSLILLLAEQDGQPPSVLARELGVKPPTITKTIARLQTQGFVRKEDSPSDQRQSLIFLTGEGRNIIRQIEKTVRKTEKDMLRGFEKKERKILVKFLSQIEDNLAHSGGYATKTGDQHDDDEDDE